MTMFHIYVANYVFSALSNVLVILSQRPLFTGHHGHSSNLATAYESINICTTVANQIVQILRDYSQNFSIGSAPYMLSYATYISATIHTRIVAQKGKNSSSFQSLLLCRHVLQEHQRLYTAAGKARTNLDRLTTQLGIEVTESDDHPGLFVGSSTGEQIAAQDTAVTIETSNFPDQNLEMGSPQLDWGLSDFDLEAIAQGFRLDGELHYLMYPVGM